MRRKPIRWTGWAGVPPIFVTLLAIASPAQGQQRTPVGVRFTLGDELYRSELTDAEIAGLEADGASLLAEELGRKIPYLDFRPLDTTAYQMHFLVAKRSATAGADALAQIGLFADLESADPTSRDIYWLTMRRPEDALQPVGTPADILDQLRLKLRLDADYTLLADSLLAHVPVADTAAAWGDPLGWVLPFHGQDLCMDRQTRLQVVSTVPSGIGPAQRVYAAVIVGDFSPPVLPGPLQPFLHRLFGEAEAGQQHLDELRQAVSAGTVRLGAIYVVEYRPSPCLRPVPPGGGVAGSGGGR